MSTTACKPVKERRRSLLPGPKVTGLKPTTLGRTAEQCEKDATTKTSLKPIPQNCKLLLPKKSGRTSTGHRETNNNCINRVSDDQTTDLTKESTLSAGSTCQLGDKIGIIRYCGQVSFAQGEWCGVELNEPTGKHDGQVKGRRYFSCRDRHGIFVPVAKVSVISKPQLSSRNKETNIIDCTKDVSDINQNSVPSETEKNRKVPICPVTGDKAKHKGSKLLQPKLTGKNKLTKLQTERTSQTNQGCPGKKRVKFTEVCGKQSIEETNTNCTFNVGQVNESITQVCDLTYTATDFTENSPPKTFLPPPEAGANDTFQVNPDHLSAASPKKPKTENVKTLGIKQLNSTYVVPDCHETGLCTANTVKSTKEAGCVKCNDLDLSADHARNIMSQPEEQDLLSTSDISHASSFGILSDQELCDDNLLTTVNAASLENGTQEWLEQFSKCSKWIDHELDEKDLDLEIAGIPTPDQEVSSQGSGREESSPELDVTRTAGLTHTTLELTFNLNPGQTSTPNSPYKADNDAESVHSVKPKLPVELKRIPLERNLVPEKQPSAVKQKGLNATFVVKDGNANELDENEDVSPEKSPKRLKTSSDVDQAKKALNASFELARTAVSQYAELVKGAEKERLQSLRKKENRLSLVEFHSVGFHHEDFSDQKLLRHSFHEDILRPKSVCSALDTSDSVNKLRKDYGKYVDTKSAHSKVLHSHQVSDTKRNDTVGCHQLKNLLTGNASPKNSANKSLSVSTKANYILNEHCGQMESDKDNLDICTSKHNVSSESEAVNIEDKTSCGLDVYNKSPKAEDHVHNSGVLNISANTQVCSDPETSKEEPCHMDKNINEKNNMDTGSDGRLATEEEPQTLDRPSTLTSTADTDTGWQPVCEVTDQSPSLSSDSPTLREVSSSSQLSDRTDLDTSGQHPQMSQCSQLPESDIIDQPVTQNLHIEGIQPDIEVHRLSFSEKNSDGERFSLDEQSQTRMNVCDEPDQEAEGLNNNQQTRETDGETSGQSGDVHRALDTDAYSGIQGPVTEATHEPQQTMVDPEPAGESQPLSALTVEDTSDEAVKACIEGVCEQEKVNIVQPSEHVEEEKEDNPYGEFVLQEQGLDSENNQRFADVYQENRLHNEDVQNENQELLVVGGDTECESGVDSGQQTARETDDDLQSVDTDTQKPEEEMEMLDMSWDNMMEFTQIRDKGHTEEDQVSLDEADDHLELVNAVHTEIITDHQVIPEPVSEDLAVKNVAQEVMDTECQDSSQSLDTSRDEGPTQLEKVPQKRKTVVRETKSSRLRGSRDSPEKGEKSQEEKTSKASSPRRLPVSSGLKKPQSVSPNKQPDTHKPKSAITKSRTTLTSHLKKPSTGQIASSAAQNPSEVKPGKTETKSLQKRKTDSSASANPVPSKKAASSAKAGKHSSQSVPQKADASSTSKIDLNVSSSSTEAKSRSFDRPSSGSKKTMGPPKSKVNYAEKKQEGVDKSQPSSKSKLQLPKSTYGKKGTSGKDDSTIPSSAPSKQALRRSTISTANPSALPTGRLGGSRAQHTRLVTSTPKTLGGGRKSLDLPNNSAVLNASYDSSLPSPKSKLSGRPAHRTTMALKKRERSASIGSDSQTSVTSLVSTLSNISRVSTQGSANPRDSKGSSPLDSSLTDGAAPSKTKRLGGKKRELPEPRKVGISISTDGRLPGKTKSSQPLASSSPKKNQNRNSKPGSVPGKPPSGGLGSKRSQQPSNQLVSAAHREEVTRLEALCESRTKELNYARMQFKQSVAGFEAMSVLVKYLTEELGAFSLPEVCSQLEKKEKSLSETQEQLNQLTVQRDALIEEIKCIQESCASKIEKLKSQHSDIVTSTKQQHQAELSQLSEKQKEDTESLKTSHEKQLIGVRREHEVHIQEKEQSHSQAIEQLEQNSQAKVAELTKQHEDALNDITMRFEDIKMTLSEKVEYLRGECDMLRRREKEHMDTFQQDSDMKVQLAIKPFQQLPAEIESLKAVLDMRNEEIHELRRDKLDLERQLEALPKAREKIKVLQHKNENLEAIISIRSDYEKSLTEKNQVLLRKLDRESKANKRLSMENEEFQWRMSQNEGGIADLLSRSISHSPTSSAASTPEPARKRRSPHPPHSPRSPRSSGSDFDRQRSPRSSESDRKSRLRRSNGELYSPRNSSGSDYDRIVSPRSGSDSRHQDCSIMSLSVHSEPSSSSTPLKGGGIKRSGTYELLDQEFEDAESVNKDMKQTDV